MPMPTEQPVRQTFWGIFSLQGSTGTIIGLPLLVASDLTSLDFIRIVSLYWFITSFLAFARAFIDRSAPAIWSILTGAVGMLPGIVMLGYTSSVSPMSLTTVVIIIGILGSVMGLLEIIDGLNGRGFASTLVGLINILVGLLLLGVSTAPAPMLASSIAIGGLLLVQSATLLFYAFRIGVHQRKASTK